MKRRDSSFTIAMSISVIFHGGLAIMGLVFMARELIDLLNKAGQAVMIDPHSDSSDIGPRMAVVMVPPLPPEPAEDQKPPPKNAAAKADQKPLPKVETHEEQSAVPDSAEGPPERAAMPYIPDAFGERDGKGDAPNSSPGERPRQSTLKGPQDQALLSRTAKSSGLNGGSATPSDLKRGDSGSGGNDGESDSSKSSLVPFGPGSERQIALTPKSTAPLPKATAEIPRESRPATPAVAAVTTPPDQEPDQKPDQKIAKPVPAADSTIAIMTPAPIATAAALPAEQTAIPAQAATTAPSTATPAESVNNTTSSSGGDARPGLPGDPGSAAQSPYSAPLSVSDSDPFAKIPTIIMRDGKVDARSGRKVIRSVRPELGLAGETELMTSYAPMVILAAKIDERGQVTDVSIVRSSGSIDIDIPCQRAVLQWVFEPTIDPKTGKGVPDLIVFSLVFY